MSTSSKILETFTQPAIVGVIAFLGAKLLGQEGTAVSPIGNISIPVVYGAVSAGGSMVGENLKQWILPMISGNSGNLVQLESSLVNPVLAGAANAGIFYLLIGEDMTNAFLIGAGSNMVGSYAYDNVIKQWAL